MARTKTATKTVRATAKKPELGSRELLLASVGAVALGRKNAISGYANAKQNVVDFSAYINNSVKNREKIALKLRKQAESKIGKLNSQAKTKVAKIQKQFKAKIAPIQQQVLASISDVKAQAEIRFAPVLAKFGKKTVAKTKRAIAKKPVAAKRVAKRVTKPVAKTTRRKAA